MPFERGVQGLRRQDLLDHLVEISSARSSQAAQRADVMPVCPAPSLRAVWFWLTVVDETPKLSDQGAIPFRSSVSVRIRSFALRAASASRVRPASAAGVGFTKARLRPKFGPRARRRGSPALRSRLRFVPHGINGLGGTRRCHREITRRSMDRTAGWPTLTVGHSASPVLTQANGPGIPPGRSAASGRRPGHHWVCTVKCLARASRSRPGNACSISGRLFSPKMKAIARGSAR